MTYLNACADSLALFQLTSSRGGWHNFFRYHIHQVVFQLTSSRGGWLRFGLVLQSLAHFNSHPHEEDDSTSEAIAEYREHFNSHPHEEDDNCGKYIQPTSSISTHILTRRMTHSTPFGSFPCNISTHILTRRMTAVWTCVAISGTFQLTSSRGGWLN